MKNIQFALFAVITFSLLSCKKDHIPGDKEIFGIGSYLTLQEESNLQIDYTDLANSGASIKVGGYGSPIQSVNIYTGEPSDSATWIFIKNVAFSEGVTLEVKASELATSLGIPLDSLSPGSSFNFINEVIAVDGRKFSLKNTSALFEPEPGYNMALRWTAFIVCQFEGPVAGDYEVIEDKWQDWGAGDVVQVLDGPGANQVNLSKVWPNPAYGVLVDPLIIDINPSTGAVTIAEGIHFGDYTASFGFNGITLEESTGFVFSCTGSIVLNVHIDAPPFGDGFYSLKLKKK